MLGVTRRLSLCATANWLPAQVHMRWLLRHK